MPIEHPEPTPATVKRLYAHAFRCAYQGCCRPLYRLDEQTGDRMLNSRICHIHARSEGGPRWDANQSAKENRSEKNLVLMCLEHASAIDVPETLAAYPPDLLREWKRKQLEEYDRIQQGWSLDAAMAHEAISASSSGAGVVVSNSTISLGGEGGKAPGAGGGGGGAIANGARGGRGGNGGGHRIDDGEYSLPWAEDCPLHQEMTDAALQDIDFMPGVGGGGEGAIGDSAIGGNGGDGGECVSAHIDIAEMRKAGFHHIQMTVGKGGKHGCHGEDTVLHFMAKDGTILKTLRALGGRSGGSRLPEAVEELSAEDIGRGFRITTLMTANSVEVRDGQFFVLGGNWLRIKIQSLPANVTFTTIIAAQWTTLLGNKAKGLYLSLVAPSGREVASQTFFVPDDAVGAGDRHWVVPVQAHFDMDGVWHLRVHSGGFLLAQFDVLVEIGPD